MPNIFGQDCTSRIVCNDNKRFIRKADSVTFNNVCVTVKMYNMQPRKDINFSR